MRILRSGVAGVAALATLGALLLSGCELREGDARDYGARATGANATIAETSSQNRS